MSDLAPNCNLHAVLRNVRFALIAVIGKRKKVRTSIKISLPDRNAAAAGGRALESASRQARNRDGRWSL